MTPENRFWSSGAAHEVRLRLSKPLQERYHILRQGERLLIERKSGDNGQPRDVNHRNKP
jgi:hypothetical protein